MSTSEQLDKIAEDVRLVRSDLLRLAVDLPDGRTLELVDVTATALRLRQKALQEEAEHLRRYRE